MKSTRKQTAPDIHAQAEACLSNAEDEASMLNEELEEQESNEFERGEIAEYFRENSLYATGIIVRRIKDAKRGVPSPPLRPFDAETIARLLCAQTTFEYDQYEVQYFSDDEAVIEADKNGNLLTQTPITAYSPTTYAQEKLVQAFREYAYASAIYAKHIKSASLLDWVTIVDRMDFMIKDLSRPLTESEAREMIALEKSAANRLRLDRIVAQLPPFKRSGRSRKVG